VRTAQARVLAATLLVTSLLSSCAHDGTTTTTPTTTGGPVSGAAPGRPSPTPVATVAPAQAPATGATPPSTELARLGQPASPSATESAPQSASVPPEALVPTPSLGSLLAGAIPPESADYGLVIQDVTSGARLGLNESRVFPSASLYKLALAWQVFQAADAGRLRLDDDLPIIDDDAQEPEPDGGVAPGQTPTVREALSAMLSVSSNAAAHAFLRVLGRHDFNQAMAQLGLNATRVPEDPAADTDDAQKPTQALTSADDMARLLQLLVTSRGLSTTARDELVGLLANGAPPDALRDTMPESVQVFDKTGNLADASNVGALLQSSRGVVILVVLDQGVNPGDARGVIAQLGQAVYESLLRPPTAPAPPSVGDAST
jgi:beta-lactamase class A